MRVAITAVAFLGSLLVVGASTLFVVLVLAGPHAGLLPQPLEVLVVVLGWIVILVVPFVAARRVWRRMDPRGGGT